MAPIATAEPAQDVAASAAAKLSQLGLDDPKYRQYSQFEHHDKSYLKSDDGYKYNDFKPTFPSKDWAALEPHTPARDRGLFADKEKKALFGAAKEVRNITKTIGTELVGVKLNSLNDQQRDELALLIAERGVVFFRDQEDWTIEQQLEFGRYYGKLHKHATTGVPARGDLDEVHVVYSHPDDNKSEKVYSGPLSHSTERLWHSDVTYELNPPSYTSFKLYSSPEAGGDTLWSNQYAAYDRLSYPMRQYLEQLSAVHSAVEQAEGAKKGGNYVRREPIQTTHPLVRVHPVTGWKSLFFNAGFVRYIVGVPQAESEWLVAFLTRHVATASDFMVRFKYNENDVAFWDNRVCDHSAVFEDINVSRRHALRVAATGEQPISVSQFPHAKSREEEIYRARGYKIQPSLSAVQAVGYKD
ncbi:TauD-domain-containing protein [Ceraceosorus guamensis]|uniref:TauD-domain-containing protein n=1 Tax=Ceraceosorus guamensis TaxID=1522189 RepID=A0A316W5Y5_9BASI|nr:TauD-domain-containing protein [Ceraceosorus guamensis]PWN43443.1 TauD-domain-containing protein [Ceraceosorus guamensis]